MIAPWKPLPTACTMAKSATAVFPDPTSPCKRRLMGRGPGPGGLLCPQARPPAAPPHAGDAEAQQEQIVEGEAPLAGLHILQPLGKMHRPNRLGKPHEVMAVTDLCREKILQCRDRDRGEIP